MLDRPVFAVEIRRARRALGAAILLATLASPRPALALDYLNVTVQPDRAVPAACLSFSTPLKRETPQVLGSFVRIQPAIDHAVEVRGKDLCIDGLRFGESYKVLIDLAALSLGLMESTISQTKHEGNSFHKTAT